MFTYKKYAETYKLYKYTGESPNPIPSDSAWTLVSSGKARSDDDYSVAYTKPRVIVTAQFETKFLMLEIHSNEYYIAVTGLKGYEV